tara:strand:+ start:993 stop:1217 length:225 start_codon:yes stop_codon:yes gene_type:complete
MDNKKGSALLWILIVLILLVIGLVTYFLVFDNSIDFKGSTSSGENTEGTNSQGTNKDEPNGGSSIPQPPALPSG